MALDPLKYADAVLLSTASGGVPRVSRTFLGKLIFISGRALKERSEADGVVPFAMDLKQHMAEVVQSFANFANTGDAPLHAGGRLGVALGIDMECPAFIDAVVSFASYDNMTEMMTVGILDDVVKTPAIKKAVENWFVQTLDKGNLPTILDDDDISVWSRLWDMIDIGRVREVIDGEKSILALRIGFLLRSALAVWCADHDNKQANRLIVNYMYDDTFRDMVHMYCDQKLWTTAKLKGVSTATKKFVSPGFQTYMQEKVQQIATWQLESVLLNIANTDPSDRMKNDFVYLFAAVIATRHEPHVVEQGRKFIAALKQTGADHQPVVRSR